MIQKLNNLVNKPVTFLKEVRQELAKVAWSTRQEVFASTLVVIGGTAILTVYIGLVDLMFSKIVSLTFR
ncbi:MAG: preprotein translocase subunit SecE [Candidatus Omnitrophica bacterium]|nr:preprotein translocase subunit SecE [Candidatus Omnitrophota bacterium]